MEFGLLKKNDISADGNFVEAWVWRTDMTYVWH